MFDVDVIQVALFHVDVVEGPGFGQPRRVVELEEAGCEAKGNGSPGRTLR